MTLLVFSGTSNGVNASDAGNWAPAQVPTTNDAIQFNATSVVTCSWNVVATMSMFTVDSSYTGTIQMTTALTVTLDLILGGS